MQSQTSSKKPIIIIIVLLLLAAGAYFYYTGTPSDSSGISSSKVTPLENADADETASRILFLLNQISSLKIDAGIFNSTVYKSLVDYTIEIPEQPVGRPNPFAPIGK